MLTPTEAIVIGLAITSLALPIVYGVKMENEPFESDSTIRRYRDS